MKESLCAVHGDMLLLSFSACLCLLTASCHLHMLLFLSPSREQQSYCSNMCLELYVSISCPSLIHIHTVLESSFNSLKRNLFSPSFHFIKQDIVHHNVVILCWDCFCCQQLQAEAMMALLIQPRLSPFSITPLSYHSS